MFGLNPMRIGLLLILAAVLTFASCDTLVTEVNNITVIDPDLGQDCLSGCHSENNNRITVPKGQWLASAHASPKYIEAYVNLNGQEFMTNDANCGAKCHTSEGYISFAVNGASGTQAVPSTIGCYTCHTPHSGDYNQWLANLDSLRDTLVDTLPPLDTLRGQANLVILEGGNGYNMGKSNMCVHCHQAANPAPTVDEDIILDGKWGPHFSAQAEVVSGVGGFRFGGEVTDTITHTGIEGKDGCIGCHFGTNGGIGAGYQFGEHTFRLEDSLGVQFSQTCNIAGCHSSVDVPEVFEFYDYASFSATDSLATLIGDSLWGRNILDTTDPTRLSFYSDSVLRKYNAPILYNYLLYQMDGSQGVHNPVLMHSLMTATAARLDTLPPQASFVLADPSDTLICDDAGVISFLNTSLSNDSNYSWIPEAGVQAIKVRNLGYLYNVPGTYTVTLIAEGPGDGVQDTAQMEIVVLGAAGAGFGADQVTFCAQFGEDVTVAFADQSVFASSWFWDFGDGTTDTTQNPSHTYDTLAASYTVTLAVEGFCGVDTLTLTDFINVRADTSVAVASFTMDSTSITAGSTVAFVNTSLAADLWYWDFGDGTTDSTGTSSPLHSYSDTISTVTEFEITLIANFGCSVDTAFDTLTVTPVTP